jgi:hypothetical protein
MSLQSAPRERRARELPHQYYARNFPLERRNQEASRCESHSSGICCLLDRKIMRRGGIVALFQHPEVSQLSRNLPEQEISRICNGFQRIPTLFLRD